MILAALLSVCFTLVVPLLSEEIWTSCEIEGHRDGPGNLTCRFGANLMVSRNDFAVQRYGLDSHNTKPNDVLFGAWHTRDQVHFVVHDGYSFDGQVSNTIVIKMSTITQNYEGRYQCQVIPNNKELVDECTLKLSDLQPHLPPSTSARSVDPTTKGDQEHQASSSSGMTVGAVVLGLPIVALTAAVTRLR